MPMPRMPAQLATPQALSMTREHWIAAAVLGGLRKATKDPSRRPDHDRGRKRNILNDIDGAIGELVVLRHLEGLGGRVRHILFSPDGSVDRPDFALEFEGCVWRLEAKAHCIGQGRRRFLINDEAHERAKGRGTHFYVPVITAYGSAMAYVGRAIDVAHVDSWNKGKLRPDGDPARMLDIKDTIQQYFGAVDLDELGRDAKVVSKEELQAVASEAGRRLDEFVSKGWDLCAMSSAQIVSLLTGWVRQSRAVPPAP